MTSLTERRLRLQPRAPDRRLPRLILVTGGAAPAALAAAVSRLPAGAAVIFRDYDAADRPARARRLARLCRARRLPLLIGGDWRLALAVGADGLHLPEGLARHGRRDWRSVRRRPGFLVTQAAHSAAAVALAVRLGADAAILSPVFATRSHPGAAPLGPLRFARMVRAADLPVYALGGIDAQSARRLAGCGAAGLAALSALTAGAATRPCKAPGIA